MSLINSLNSGISGLRGFQTKLDVVGNNIANVNTSGFKSRRVAFSELLNQNKVRIGSRFETAPKVTNQVGLGVRVSSVDLDFSQGTLSDTNRSTDLALNGDGFFMVGDSQNLMLTRAGNFSFNKNSQLVTQNGLNVKGYNANEEGSIVTGRGVENITINFEDVYQPQQTLNVDMTGNLNANTSVPQRVQSLQAFTTNAGQIARNATKINELDQNLLDLEEGDIINIDGTLNDGTVVSETFEFTEGATMGDLTAKIQEVFDGEAKIYLEDGTLVVRSTQLGDSQLSMDLSVGDGSVGSMDFPTFSAAVEGDTKTVSISSTVYDSLGQDHTLIAEFEQQQDGNWLYKTSFLEGGEIISINGEKGKTQGPLTFDEGGNLTSDDSITITFDPGTNAGPVTFNLNFAKGTKKLTQFDGSTTASVYNQDGYAKGELLDFFIDGDGLIIGTYSNGKSKNLAQLSVSNVANPEGLISQGNGLYEITPQAGDLRVNTAANLADTTVNSGFLEGSNVDLTEQFTELIVTQRAFQSSARVITTSDQILGETVQLKR